MMSIGNCFNCNHLHNNIS